MYMNEDITERKGNYIERVNLDSPIIWWLVAASLFTTAIISIFLYPMHHDVGWYLYASGRLLDGAKLYQDIVDVNPPLICYLGIPSVWIAHVLGGSEMISFKIYILLLVILSLATCRHVLNQTLLSTPVVQRNCLLLVLMFLLLRPYFFAQREHIMLVLVVPYILAAVGRAMNRPLNRSLMLCIGGLAGLGLALKPHFVLLWLTVETYLGFIRQIRLSWRRPENLGIATVVVSYGAFVFVVHQDYYEEIVPLAIKFYGTFNCSTSYLFQHPYGKLWVVAFLGFFLVRPIARHRELRRILLIASASFLTIAFVQHKGFYYHFYPAAATTVLLLVVIVFGYTQTIKAIKKLIGPRKSMVPLVITLGLFVLAGLKVIGLSRCSENPLLSPMIRIVKDHAKGGRPILLLSSSVFPAFPLVNYSGARWSSRFNCLWFLPRIYSDVSSSEREFPYHSKDEIDVIERFLVDAVISDIMKSPPVLLIVDCSPIKQGFWKTEFDYIEYFLQDPRFAEIWPNYHFLTAVGYYRVFKLRRDDLSDLGDLRETYRVACLGVADTKVDKSRSKVLNAEGLCTLL